MELTPKQRKQLEKLAKFTEDNEIATVESFIELEEKIEEVKEAVDEKLSSIQEELKKKLESELVLEIDREELRGEDGFDGDDGEDYILTEQDLEDIAKKVKVPVVEKVIEKTEVIRETPIITNEIKEVALKDTAEDIRNKLELLDGDERLEFKAIKQSEEILKDIKELKARPVRWESGRGTGGGNLEVFEDGTKRGSGTAINFLGVDVAHDGHTATVDLSLASSFESYNKNLRAYPYTITETSPTVTTLTYTTPTGTITKTITETSATQTDIVISGVGTKTIVETSPTLTTITYS